MEKEKILEEIKKRKEELVLETDALSKPDEEIKFFQDFFKNNSIRKVEDVVRINQCDFLTAHFKSRIPSMKLEQIKKIINTNQALFIPTSPRSFEQYLRLIQEPIKEKTDLEVHVVNSNDEALHNKKLQSEIENNRSNLESLDIDSIVSLISEDVEAFADSIDCIFGLTLITYSYTQCQKQLNALEQLLNKKVSAKFKTKEINQFLKQNIDFSRLNDYFTQIRKYYEKLNAETASKRKRISMLNKVYENLEQSFLTSIEQVEITNYNEMIQKIPDEKFRLQILEFINEHNQKYYQELQNTHEKLIQNSEVKYHALLQKYAISKDEYCISQIMKNPYDDVEYILKELKNTGIKNKKSIVKILQSSTKERVSNLMSLKESGNLKNAFLIDNIDLFDENNDSYNTLLKNLDCLIESKVNIFYLNNSQDILLTSPQQLKHNMSIIEQYDLLSSMNSNTKYTFLQSEHLEEIIDNILELGYEEYLEQDLNLLNYNKSKWLRVRILKDLNIPISNKEELEEVLVTNKFIIPDEKLEEYIYNVVPNHLSVKINSLSQEQEQNIKPQALTIFDDTKRTYNINGVIISKNKTKRNLEKLSQIQMDPEDRLMVAIVHGSILNDEEYSSIKSAIKTKVDTKK